MTETTPSQITTVLPDAKRPSEPDFEDVQREHMSPDQLIGLGRSAVDYSIKKADYALDYNPESAGRVYDDFINRSLTSDRAELEDLSRLERWRANRLFTKQPESAWIDEQLGVQELPLIPKRYVQKLIQKDNSGNYVIGNSTFGNFLEWHNHRLASRQAEYDTQVISHKKVFAARIYNAHKAGWLPSSAVQNLGRLHRTDMYVDDGFTTELASSWAYAVRATGNHRRHMIVDGPTYAEEGKHLTHEFIHILEGAIKNVHAPGVEDSLTNRVPAGLERLFGTMVGGHTINEALVEHLADSLLHGNLDTINPTSRARKKSKAYDQGRHLLYVLAEKGDQKIDIRLFTNALFENDSEAESLGEQSAQSQLKDALHAAFPFTDVIDEIQNFAPTKDISTLAEYAEKLATRSRRHRVLPKKLAALTSRHLEPKNKAA